MYHNSLKVYICGIPLIKDISSSANIWAVRVFTKPLLSSSAAATLVRALIFLHLVYYCIFHGGIHASVLPCSNLFKQCLYVSQSPLGVVVVPNWLPDQTNLNLEFKVFQIVLILALQQNFFMVTFILLSMVSHVLSWYLIIPL